VITQRSPRLTSNYFPGPRQCPERDRGEIAAVPLALLRDSKEPSYGIRHPLRYKLHGMMWRQTFVWERPISNTMSPPDNEDGPQPFGSTWDGRFGSFDGVAVEWLFTVSPALWTLVHALTSLQGTGSAGWSLHAPRIQRLSRLRAMIFHGLAAPSPFDSEYFAA
jgi:hypothetical protein